MSKTRPRGFAPWNPRTKTLHLLGQIDAVLIEYDEYLPLAIRQVFYRLIGAHGYEKTEPAYSRLCETIGRARRAGYISFDSIRDDGVTRLEPSSWDGTQDFRNAVARTAANFKLDRQDGQQTRLWILTEAAGMAPMIAKVANQYGVPVLSSGGFDSLTAKHDLAQELSDAGCAEVLHIGDRDPSGVHLFKASSEDVGALSVGLGSFTPPMFTRLAVTPQQIVEMNLPTAPAKKTDNRAFSGETVQAEAIPPNVLTELVRTALKPARTKTPALMCFRANRLRGLNCPNGLRARRDRSLRNRPPGFPHADSRKKIRQCVGLGICKIHSQAIPSPQLAVQPETTGNHG